MLAIVSLCGALASTADEPAAAAAEPVPSIVTPPTEQATEDAPRKGPIRIAVNDFAAEGVSDRHAKVVMVAMTTELRKLERTHVIGADEVRVMLDHESNKQLLGCADASCLAEIADALGVDTIVTGSLSLVGDQHVMSFKRVEQREARVTSVERRFEKGNGEEFLVAVGPAVAELFPDVPLQPGAERGVAKEMALRLNPPPLPIWVFWGGVGTSALALGAAGTFGVLNALGNAELAQYKVDNKDNYDQATATALADDADRSAYLAFGFGGAAIALGIATGVAALFTDFWGYAEMNAEALE